MGGYVGGGGGIDGKDNVCGEVPLFFSFLFLFRKQNTDTSVNCRQAGGWGV